MSIPDPRAVVKKEGWEIAEEDPVYLVGGGGPSRVACLSDYGRAELARPCLVFCAAGSANGVKSGSRGPVPSFFQGPSASRQIPAARADNASRTRPDNSAMAVGRSWTSPIQNHCRTVVAGTTEDGRWTTGGLAGLFSIFGLASWALGPASSVLRLAFFVLWGRAGRATAVAQGRTSRLGRRLALGLLPLRGDGRWVWTGGWAGG